MQPENDEFGHLVQQAHQGCRESARRLLALHGDTIRRVIRRHLHVKLRSRFDSDDFGQSVWETFYSMPLERLQFQSPDDLGRYLAAIAANKVTDEFRRLVLREKHGSGRETSLSAIGEPDHDRKGLRQETPSKYALADERWELMTRNVPNLKRTVLEMLRAGYTHMEISLRTGLHVKAIQRYLRKISAGHLR